MVRRAALVGAAALALGATPALAAPSESDWLDATAGHREKLPAGFADRLDDTLPDGTLGVIVSTTGRGPAAQALASATTTFAHWYESADGFYAHVTPAQLTELLASPTVEHVAPDYRMTFTLSVSTPDVHARQTATEPGLYSLDMATGPFGTLTSEWPTLDADQVTGNGVTAAVIDSGVDGTHRDFGGWDCVSEPYQPCESRIKEAVALDQLLLAGIEPEGEPTTDLASGHGTHVAGIIAGNGRSGREAEVTQADIDAYGGDARPIGMAPESSLVSVKAGDSQWAGLFLFGLDWVNLHAADYGIRAVNNSTGCTGGCAYDPDGLEDEILQSLFEQGVVTTFAAGNDGGDPDGLALSGSAQSPWVLGVASYDPGTHRLAATSSRGVAGAPLPDPATWTPQDEPAAGHRRPDIAAPGEGISSAANLTGGTSSVVPRANTGASGDATDAVVTGGFRDYVNMSGTSMATPHVTGAAVILFGACPSATALDVMRALMASAGLSVQATDGSRPAQPYEVGYGRLDVRAAIDWLAHHVASCAALLPNQAPTASLGAPEGISAIQAARFDATASADPDGSIVSYAWDFGDGATAATAVADHVFTWAGSYTVTLEVTDDQGATSQTERTVTVTDTPASGFKRLLATGLDNHTCDPMGWTLTVDQSASPASVALVWANGSRERVPFVSKSGKVSQYRTTSHLSEIAVQGWTDVPQASTAKLRVTRGPCH